MKYVYAHTHISSTLKKQKSESWNRTLIWKSKESKVKISWNETSPKNCKSQESTIV